MPPNSLIYHFFHSAKIRTFFYLTYRCVHNNHTFVLIHIFYKDTIIHNIVIYFWFCWLLKWKTPLYSLFVTRYSSINKMICIDTTILFHGMIQSYKMTFKPILKSMRPLNTQLCFNCDLFNFQLNQALLW